MTNKIILFILCSILVFGAFYVVYLKQYGNLVGFVVLDDQNTSVKSNFTQQQALDELNNSKVIMQDMQANNFSVIFVNDTLSQAELTFEQAKYAEILRLNSSEKEKNDARQALKLVDWKNISYNSVIYYTEIIKEREKQAFVIYDLITTSENNIKKYYGNYSFDNRPKSILLLEQAKNSFYEDRYEESLSLIKQSKIELESEKSQKTTLDTLRNNAKSFIQRNWYYITLVIVVLVFIIYFSYKSLMFKTIKSKIIKMESEYKAVQELMKKTQTERFKENKISGLVYNIRMKKYQERLNSIKEELPVLKEKLERLKKSKK